MTTNIEVTQTTDPKLRCMERADIILNQLAAIQKVVVRYKRDAQAGAGARWDACGTLARVTEELANIEKFLGV